MRNKERIKRRINRDKLRRIIKKQLKYGIYDNATFVFTIQHFNSALRRCNLGVRWKLSVQMYNQKPIENILVTIDQILNNDIPQISEIKDIKDIVIKERGKERIITPIKIQDRIHQKVFCDYSFLPTIKDSLIYDNGASLPGKGVDFARRRMIHHLRKAVKEYGGDFYVLNFDFKSYFDSIPHSTCRKVLNHYYNDKRLVEYAMSVIKGYHKARARKIKNKSEREMTLRLIDDEKSCGICLGSQVSQLFALVIPNALDHYIKDKCGFRHYVRYMDDGAIFAKTKAELRELVKGMEEVCAGIGLTLHKTKTKIVKSTRGFVFLKQKYNVVGNKIIKRLTRKTIVRMRRKLKRFKGLFDKGRMTLDDVYASMQSWMEHAKGTKSWNTVKNMFKLYDKLFGGYKLTVKYKKRLKREMKDNVLQTDKWSKYRWRGDIA